LPAAIGQPGTRVTGRVVDSTGAAIRNAEVTLRPQDSRNPRTTLVSEAGEFSFRAVPPGFYEMEAVSPGFRLNLKFIRVPAEAELRIPAIALEVGQVGGCPEQEQLAPPFVSWKTSYGQTGLGGQIRTVKGVPLALAKVKAVSLEPDFRITTRTGPDGAFHFHNLPPGDYSVRASSDGYADFAVDSVVVRAGSSTRLSGPPLAMELCPAGALCPATRRPRQLEVCGW
jgi:carboxypeptidase family protein